LISAIWAKVGKAEVVKVDNDENIADGLDLAFLNELPNELGPLYVEMATASAAQALHQVSAVAKVRGNLADLLKQSDKKAIAWAENKAASMVGKKWIDGELVNNPDSKWVIEDSTRDMLRGKINQALKEGWSKDKLAKRITGDVIGKDRADLIAQTELGFAHSAGNQIGWATSGRIKGRYSILSADHEIEDVCDDNAAAGVIPMDEPYPSGDEGYPFHPGCFCVEVAVLDDSALEEAA